TRNEAQRRRSRFSTGCYASLACLIILFAGATAAGAAQAGATAVAAVLTPTIIEGTTGHLDGTGSHPLQDVASWQWDQLLGSRVALSDPAAPTPTFVGPVVNPGGEILRFQLTVADAGGMTSTDTVDVTIRDNGLGSDAQGRYMIETATGEPVAVTVAAGGSFVEFAAIDPDSLTATKNRPLEFMYGMFDFTIRTDTRGGGATVEFVFPDPLPAGYIWYKYTDDDVWQRFSQQTFPDVGNPAMITVVLVDGAEGDQDKVENNLIVDPSGPARQPSDPTAGLAPLPDSGEGGICFVDTLLR
ncbi:MAG: choice-of-anchor U domain-containing protein, partial [Desulfatibacillaceae bacterium]